MSVPDGTKAFLRLTIHSPAQRIHRPAHAVKQGERFAAKPQ